MHSSIHLCNIFVGTKLPYFFIFYFLKIFLVRIYKHLINYLLKQMVTSFCHTLKEYFLKIKFIMLPIIFKHTNLKSIQNTTIAFARRKLYISTRKHFSAKFFKFTNYRAGVTKIRRFKGRYRDDWKGDPSQLQRDTYKSIRREIRRRLPAAFWTTWSRCAA